MGKIYIEPILDAYVGALINREINLQVKKLRTPDIPQEKSQQITEALVSFQGFIWQEEG